MSRWYVYLSRQEDGLLKTGITKDIFDKIIEPELLCWYKHADSEEEAIVEKARISLLSNEEKESLLPWYTPTPEFRKANVLLSHYFKVTPPIINGMNNREYKEWLAAFHVSVRGPLVRKYSWAIPTEEAVRAVIEHGPVVEMGAGTGYWAYLVKLLGGDIIAYDINPPAKEHSLAEWNVWHDNGIFTEILKGSPGILDQHSDRTLFLCWPPADSIMAMDCLGGWAGETLIFIGERGVTAEKNFFNQLDNHFSLQKIIPIPQWANANDAMTIWKKLD